MTGSGGVAQDRTSAGCSPPTVHLLVRARPDAEHPFFVLACLSFFSVPLGKVAAPVNTDLYCGGQSLRLEEQSFLTEKMQVNCLRKIAAVAAAGNLVFLSLGEAVASDPMVDELPGGPGRQYTSGDDSADPPVGPGADKGVKEHSWSEDFRETSSTRLSTVLQRRSQRSSPSRIVGTRDRPQLTKTGTAPKILVAATVIAVTLWRLASVFRMCLRRYAAQRHAGRTPRSLSDSEEDPNVCTPPDGNHSDDGGDEGRVAIPLMQLSREGNGDGLEEAEGAAAQKKDWKASDKLAAISTVAFAVVFVAAYTGLLLFFNINKAPLSGHGSKENSTSLVPTAGPPERSTETATSIPDVPRPNNRTDTQSSPQPSPSSSYATTVAPTKTSPATQNDTDTATHIEFAPASSSGPATLAAAETSTATQNGTGATATESSKAPGSHPSALTSAEPFLVSRNGSDTPTPTESTPAPGTHPTALTSAEASAASTNGTHTPVSTDTSLGSENGEATELTVSSATSVSGTETSVSTVLSAPPQRNRTGTI